MKKICIEIWFLMKSQNIKIKNIVFKFILAFVILIIFLPSCRENLPKNKYPVVLLHGFMGWDREELFGYKYWGGLNDLQEILRDEGYEVYTVSVGPVSSNWDRACEAYAKIKGEVIDYGLAHSKGNTHTYANMTSEERNKYDVVKHNRFYRENPIKEQALIPDWGEIGSDGKIRKIHIISHSMGGQTARLLAYLLNRGSNIEINTDYSKEAISRSSLFDGGKDWIASVVTLSTPHDGTTLAEIVPKALPDWIQYFEALGVVSGVGGHTVYDFKLNQFDVKKNKNEDYKKYYNRIKENELLNSPDNTDFALFDLSLKGAEIFNRWVRAVPEVYYFSIATESTELNRETGYEIPEEDIFPPLKISAKKIGKFSGKSSSWFKNDGVVNTISMDGPEVGSNDVIVFFDINNVNNSVPHKGIWNYCGIRHSWDHYEIVGRTHLETKIFGNELSVFYINMCKALSYIDN